MKRRKTEKQKERWRGIEDDYRRRHRFFVMEHLPTMPVKQWDEYTQWVADFGTGMNGQRVKQTLSRAKDIATVTVTNGTEMTTVVRGFRQGNVGRLIIQGTKERAVLEKIRPHPRNTKTRLQIRTLSNGAR